VSSGELKSKREIGNSKLGLFAARATQKIENLALDKIGLIHPGVFFVRVANKGVMVDVARKSGREKT